ncbi:Serine/threonine-protein kinase YPK2/YKR2 [Choanephora cucurbitarum]|uniref:Serine/threonine-protein kinase YPK2/YKR2 n=1 Tax=Choanephora cucurbitarum TaxID=101091 RepID=A0A1C7MYU2_9FUNG|nr:Serine/threonine-protein kinase YPK2/YKR2 [Choanephora cucurbitarum]
MKGTCRKEIDKLEDNQRQLKKPRLSVRRLAAVGAEPDDSVLSIMEALSQYTPKDVKRAFNTYMSIHEKDTNQQNQMGNVVQSRCSRLAGSLTGSMNSGYKKNIGNNNDDDEDDEETCSTIFDINTLQISESNMIPSSSNKQHNTRNKIAPCCFSANKESSVDSASFWKSPMSSNAPSGRASRALSEQLPKQQHIRRPKCTSFKRASSFLFLSPGGLPELDAREFVVTDGILGTGQMSVVRLGRYGNLPVACKSKRDFTNIAQYYAQANREMTFAARLSTCRYMNKYLGWVVCRKSDVEESSLMLPKSSPKQSPPKLYIVQKYISNRDGRTYLNRRGRYMFMSILITETMLKPQEVLQASICLFSALSDAHNLDIGIVDLKLENFLIDSSGTGYLTDFGSCIMFERGQKKVIDLNKHDVSWTKNVAPPEMLNNNQFTKASDVFMATLILAEMMAFEASHKDFQRTVLRRHHKNRHEVEFSSEYIHESYQMFFPLLKAGLANSSKKRPSAQAMLDTLLQMRKK